MNLIELKKIVSSLLSLKDDTLVDIVCATYVSNFLDGDPLWTMLVGAPSSGKTETMMGLAKCPGIYILSSLTPNTLASGWSIGSEKDDSSVETSLLSELTGKLLIMKDFTTVLDMRLEFQREILSQLREIYDGYFKKRWGTKKTFEWQGKMGFLAGVTDVIYRRHKVISQMGERWVYYRIENDSPLERAKQAFRMAGKEDAIRAEIKMGFHDFLTSLPRHNRPLEDESKLEETFAALATLVTVARTPVQRDGVNKIILNKPSPEGPFRFVKQMLKIARALCRVHQTEVMTDAVYKVIIKTSVDSIPTMRWKVLEWLWANKDTVDFSIVDIERSTRTPRITLTYYLDELVILELVDRAGHRFSLSPLAREIFEGSGM